MKNSYTLANYLAEHVEKENIISEIFDIFDINCQERCNIEPSRLDSLIKKFYDNDVCDTKLLQDIIDFIKNSKKDSQNKENELIKTILTYLDETLLEDISIEKAASDLHISYYYMCHVFKEKFNVSPNTYRTRKRLEKAMRMLVESDDKISDISISCGYNNVSYFTETFTKYIGVSPKEFKEANRGKCFHSFYDYGDMLLASKMGYVEFLDKKLKHITQDIEAVPVCVPDENFTFLHEAAIIEYHGVLYSSWYNCREKELRGYTPICGKRSCDGGKTWSASEVLCEDKSEKIMYCPPVYGIYDDKLYMFVNQMVAPDHMHSLDLYVLNNETDKFEFLWSRPIPFKLNTNVVRLPNGKLMLPGRIGELDGFPITPAVLISDSGKIDTEWRVVKIAENGVLPDGTKLIYPEISVICAENVLYMFCRNDSRKVPLVYISEDFGETWSNVHSHDIPYVSSKIYCGELSDGRHYMICNTEKFDRTVLTAYFTEDNSKIFTKRLVISDGNNDRCNAMHYPAACEYNGYLYIISTKGYTTTDRGSQLFKIHIKDI